MKKLIILDDTTNVSVADNFGCQLPDIISFIKDKSFAHGDIGKKHLNANAINKVSILDKYSKDCILLPIFGIYHDIDDTYILSMYPSDNKMDESIVGYAVLTKMYIKETFKYNRVSINKMSSSREEYIKEFLSQYFLNLRHEEKRNVYIVVREDNGVITNESPSIYSNNKAEIFRIAAGHLLSENETLSEFILESQTEDFCDLLN